MAVSHKIAQQHSCEEDLLFITSQPEEVNLSHRCPFWFTPVLCVGFLNYAQKVLFERVHILNQPKCCHLSVPTNIGILNFFFPVCKIMEFSFFVCVCACEGEGRDPFSIWGEVCHT